MPSAASALALRLASDERDLADSLSTSPSPPLPLGREVATRLLMEATPTAIKRLRSIAASGSEKPAVSACAEILRHSPIVPQASTPSVSLSLPPEALSTLASALASFSLGTLQSAPAPVTYTVEPS